MSTVAPEIVLSPGSLTSLPTRPPTPPLAHSEPETAPIEDAPAEPTDQKHIEIPASLPVTAPVKAPTPSDAKLPAEPREPAVATPIRLTTPPVAQSPHTPNTNATSTRGRTPKSVVFSGKAHYQDAPVWDSENVRPSPSLPPSRTLRATKGILKASPVPIRIDFNAGRDINLAEMLDSVIKQLNGADKTSRVEAYSTLSRALRASNNLPDRIALNERMGTMLNFLQRDILTPTSKDPTDHSLVTNSLMMLLTLLYFPSISNTIPVDFGIFIIDHCIKSFEDQKVSKEVVRSLMQVVFTQNFPLRVMTSERMRRLLFALHNIEQHVASSKILIFRARIYKRLLKQCRSHLMTHPEWMPDLFTDMLSTIKDVRYAAIDLGYEAALSLGMEKDVTARVLRFMSTPGAENGKTYLDFYIEKLSAQFKKPAAIDATDATTTEEVPDDKKIKDLVAVPKIWTILLLFIRSRPLDRWEALPKWLNLLPPCFNSTDIQCRLEANIAWSRFIFVAHLHESVFTRMLSSAIVPAFVRQLSRRQFGRKSEADYRKAVLGGICAVFYYSYGANTPVRLFDRLWDATFPLLQAMTSAESHLESRICALSIITNLFDTSNRGPWNEEFVLGADPFPTPDQIPCIDSRWINRNLAKIQKLVQPLIESNVMNLASSQSSISRLYQSLSSTVCVLSAKEIKVSNETTEYLTYFLNTIIKLWSTGVPGVDGDVDAQSTETFMEGIKNYIMLAVDGLGLLPFMETVTVKSTASADATPRKCVEHLVLILTTLPKGMKDCPAYGELLTSVFTPFFADKFAITMAKMLHSNITSTSAANVTENVWKLTASAFVPTLSTTAPSYVNIYQASSDVPLGRVYKDVNKVLEIGLKASFDLKWEDWDSLYAPLCHHSHALSGTAGESMAVNEPLAKSILAQLVQPDLSPSLNLLMIALIVVRKSAHPFDKAAVDSAYYKLWGVTNSKTANPDPFDALYSLQNRLLTESYAKFDVYNKENFIEALFHDIDEFLERCSAPFIVKAINLLQPGFLVWLQDSGGRIDKTLYDLIKCFFTHVCALLAREPASSISLEAFEPLLTAGFQSKHSEFINLFATMWNRLFQDATEVQYTDSLKELLIGLQPKLELVLPGLQESSEPALVDYRETQASELAAAALPVPAPATKPIKTGSRPSSRQSVRSLTGTAPSGRTTRSRTNSRSTTPARANIATPARVRHDNSQVDFVAIEATEDKDAHTQALTEHQKEIRERQRMELHFLPSLLRATSDESQIVTQQAEASAEPSTPPKTEVAPPETPKTARSFDGYIESSPTPRRSDTPTILDQDMSDVPSSPLQGENVRRYPLIPDMHKRASAQMREDWPDFSSPVNSSPIQPSRLTRSQKRATENSSQQLADTLMTDADSQPDAAEASMLSAPLSLPEIDIKQEETEEDNALLPVTDRRNPKRVRKSLSELPPLHMKTRSSARSRSLSKLSDTYSPVDAPSTQESNVDVQKEGDATQDTQESDVPVSLKNAGSTPSASRTQKRRRQSSIVETPSQPVYSERTLRRRSMPLQATPTPSTRRSKRISSVAPEQRTEENADGETDQAVSNSTPTMPPRVSERAATPGVVNGPAEDNDPVQPLASANTRKRRRSSSSIRRSRDRAKKHRSKRVGRNVLDSESRESSQSTTDSQPSEELEPGAEVSIDTQAIMQITAATADGGAEAVTVVVKEEPKEPSSPLSELSEEDALAAGKAKALGETTTAREETTTPEEETTTPAEATVDTAVEVQADSGVPPPLDVALPSDEEAESQVLSELAAARQGEAESVVEVSSSVVPPSAESEADADAPAASGAMDVDTAEDITAGAVSAAAQVPESSAEVAPVDEPTTAHTQDQEADDAPAQQESPTAGAAQEQTEKTPAMLVSMLRSGLQSLRGMTLRARICIRLKICLWISSVSCTMPSGAGGDVVDGFLFLLFPFFIS